MIGSIPIGIWQRFKNIGAEISLIVVEWQVNLGTEWPFYTNQGQYMCSDHPWPLLWQHALSRSSWPNYPASYEVVKALWACLGSALDSAWSRTLMFEYSRMRKTKTFCSACMRFWLDLDILHGWSEEVCLLCMEGSLFCFQQMTMTTWHLEWSHWSHVTVVTMHVICLRQRDNSRSLECCFVVDDGICCR